MCHYCGYTNTDCPDTQHLMHEMGHLDSDDPIIHPSADVHAMSEAYDIQQARQDYDEFMMLPVVKYYHTEDIAQGDVDWHSIGGGLMDIETEGAIHFAQWHERVAELHPDDIEEVTGYRIRLIGAAAVGHLNLVFDRHDLPIMHRIGILRAYIGGLEEQYNYEQSRFGGLTTDA